MKDQNTKMKQQRIRDNTKALSSLDDYHKEQLQLLLNGEHATPHKLLGMHFDVISDCMKVTVLDPQADDITIIYGDKFAKKLKLKKSHDIGLYTGCFEGVKKYFDYKIKCTYGKDSYTARDAYAFMPGISETDIYLFNQGEHRQLYNMMGAQFIELEGVMGTRFVTWAPNAKRLSVVGDFNCWDGRRHQMRIMGSSGLWELFIPDLKPGEIYKFEIKGQEDKIFLKLDPYAQQTQLRPNNAAIVAPPLTDFAWTDEEWLAKRAHENILKKPMNIYEVHLASWGHPSLRKIDRDPINPNHEEFHNYRELAVALADYANEMGFTHIELLPIAEHPLDQSWGYQITAFYSPTARYGTPEDFAWMINYLHEHNIGLILDWVPAHFPKDAFSLGRFDGTALYEHEDPRQGEHTDWGTYIFNYGRNEVRNFLIANALYWLDRFHVDGLRVDAVASMLYLDYSRNDGEWVPNKYGGNENIEAIELLKQLNTLTHQMFPGTVTIAEESTAWSGVSRPTYIGGLGFSFKWNMGWMHDTLKYFSFDPIFRSYHHGDLTFSMLYAFSENFILPLSHDEVVHGKSSLINKMPGEYEQKFNNLKILYTYMLTHPGKNLFFMGGDIAQWDEWNSNGSLDWNLLDFPIHRKFNNFIKSLNHFYLKHSTLWENDFSGEGFEWIEAGDYQQSVYSYVRWNNARDKPLITILNLTPIDRINYRIGVPYNGRWEVAFDSNSGLFNDNTSTKQIVTAENGKLHEMPYQVGVNFAGLSAIILRRC